MSQCLSPYVVENHGILMEVPCGKCPNCRARKITQWVQRLNDELKCNDFAFFVTLSYRDDALHYVRSPSGDYVQTLNREDYTKFLHKLKYVCDKSFVGMRYYGCGEYGKSTSRPHYHFVIFLKVAKNVNEFGLTTMRDESKWTKSPISIAEKILSQWELGDVCQCVPVTDERVFRYICKDMAKNVDRLTADVRLATFHTMSKRPPIGIGWAMSQKDFYLYCYNNFNRLNTYVPRVYVDHLAISDADVQKHNEELIKNMDYELQNFAKANGLAVDTAHMSLLQKNKALADLRLQRINEKQTRF